MFFCKKLSLINSFAQWFSAPQTPGQRRRFIWWWDAASLLSCCFLSPAVSANCRRSFILFQSLTIIQIKRIKRFSASIRGEIWLRGAHCKQFAVWIHCKKKHLLYLHFLYMADLMKDRHSLICNAGFSIFPDDYPQIRFQASVWFRKI